MLNCYKCKFADFDKKRCTQLLTTLPTTCPHAEERKPITNADRIRSMSDEEMAEEIVLLFCRFPLDYEKLLEWLKEDVDGKAD